MIEHFSLTGWCVYILRCSDGSLYTGCTNNLEKRLAVHNLGKGGSYTRSHLPVTIAYQELVADHSSALKREAAIKKLSRQEKMTLISSG